MSQQLSQPAENASVNNRYPVERLLSFSINAWRSLMSYMLLRIDLNSHVT